ncbi:MAG: hypothetical protein Q8P86_01925, partial [bacterium]|nr:hypothetical protein [bacterium]
SLANIKISMNTKYIKRISVIVGFAFVFVAGTVLASGHFISPDAFTQIELDTNWEADREFPTDGVTSVTAFGRDDVAQIGVDSSETASGTFERTEGIKTVGAQNFGTAVEVDLYVNPDWQDNATRAGFWVVGDDGAGARDNLFAIVEYVNLEPSTSGASAQGDHEGWRVWDSVNGWTDLATDVAYGEWATLGIELSTSTEEYVYYINGVEVARGPGGENFIRELFLNSYNYGLDEFPTLGNDSYAAHWHNGEVSDPASKEECKNGGWENFGFSNQGQCIRFVNTGQDSR